MNRTARERFEAAGLVKLPGLLPDELTSRALNLVHRKSEQAGVRRNGIWLLDQLTDEPVQRHNKRLLEGIRHAPVLADLVTQELEAAVEAAAGGPARPMMKWPQLLFSFPAPGAWSLPETTWHVDLPKLPNRRTTPGVQAFAMLDTVEPGGGGTVVVQGGHRLLYDIPWLGSRQITERLRRERYFRELMSKQVKHRGRFLRETVHCGDADLRVVELTGRRGDVYLIDMRLLHSPAPNVSAAPRIMWTQRFLTEATHDDMTALFARMRAGYGTAGEATAAAPS
ncbi:MAG: phytanoyl-CoA dioxygenase family protein [Acidobacteriota bacterium]|nr:phytanoyl-CoA dioxygenase family protein [Acidobacteriota bacterium]